MAKFNITVELDWLEGDGEHGDGYSLDEELKSSIAKQITNNITSIQSKEIEKKVNNEIKKAFNKQVDKKINSIITSWLNGDVIKINDEWGEPKEEHKNIKAMLKKKFDNMLFENVDEYGKSGRDSYSSKNETRLEWLFNKFGKKQIDEKVKKTVEEIRQKLETTVEESVKQHVGESIFKAAGLGKLLKKSQQTIEMRS